MEMEVVIPVSPVDFNFDSNCSSPYMTAPSSPTHFGNFFFSAPTSPTRASAFFQELNQLARHSSAAASSVPFDREQKPAVPKSKRENDFDQNEDFEFGFSGPLDRTLTAEELFDGGKIRPLRPPPLLPSGGALSAPVSNASSPRSNTSRGKKINQEAFSSRHQKRDFDPLVATTEETRRREGRNQQSTEQEHGQRRGRERASLFSYSSTSSGRKASRSLSPLRVSDIAGDSDDISQSDTGFSSTTSNSTKASTISSHTSFLSSILFTKGYRKWRFKDFLLFRSASEGRATGGKDVIGKYVALSKKAAAEDDVRNSSFRSTESCGSVSRRRGPVSAHELHYTVNRAASEEMKKKTPLPYRQGLWGCLGFNFNPGNGVHKVTRGMGSLTRSRS
ncbi:hypothetical protein L6164_031999 [Bauhinia variegata]|uniref:Uncharacterized protein n=1 Tax=Bauhinia variegata TaxID=167791 RepID=A0ACB9KMS1_BAUVA|nr:hypothetical protein L6164_031999 [Bauhinia variegata]